MEKVKNGSPKTGRPFIRLLPSGRSNSQAPRHFGTADTDETGKESEGVYVPNELNVEYHSQRASEAGFMLTEATPIGRHAVGYPGVPGIFSPSQIAGWNRATVFSFIEGKEILGASDIPISGNALDGSEYAASPPRAMTVQEIQDTMQEYAATAKRAREAGFDGVEIHPRREGYLLDQFLHDNVNTRTDECGTQGLRGPTHGHSIGDERHRQTEFGGS
ncbi:hypothetical protein N7489_001503 [Penicillium chrysogenum]|uniref:NADH:flavin oxidoreductase/NADH oxidase N-terminal domain-containing protein n=1 Tax=Penicillium chrysogenum TaxID=5076 RepID=A0ABQ8WIY1_PENCH|nr:uncharacterized protein N7489_001503 [Penicillium chrysogenum]KAJ5251093.1 hypothetical protein N7489_001503 [Penicillium chrysogenum]KAJ5269994.1 hypothetical protein N7505_005752 [Penicillium chrysogenum]KAJ6147272.1 hypothetical protein N7497_009254 [Penicillium chrysogenum]